MAQAELRACDELPGLLENLNGASERRARARKSTLTLEVEAACKAALLPVFRSPLEKLDQPVSSVVPGLYYDSVVCATTSQLRAAWLAASALMKISCPGLLHVESVFIYSEQKDFDGLKTASHPEEPIVERVGVNAAIVTVVKAEPLTSLERADDTVVYKAVADILHGLFILSRYGFEVNSAYRMKIASFGGGWGLKILPTEMTWRNAASKIVVPQVIGTALAELIAARKEDHFKRLLEGMKNPNSVSKLYEDFMKSMRLLGIRSDPLVLRAVTIEVTAGQSVQNASERKKDSCCRRALRGLCCAPEED